MPKQQKELPCGSSLGTKQDFYDNGPLGNKKNHPPNHSTPLIQSKVMTMSWPLPCLCPC